MSTLGSSVLLGRTKSLSILFYLAASAPVFAQDAAKPAKEAKPSKTIEEVIVSAAYRDQDIQDVVGGIQVFGGAELDKNGVSGMEDYLREVPSVSLQKSAVGKANIAIRGISNLNSQDGGYADGSPTVGVYFNDVAIQGSGVFPDLNVYDLARIEVLKGPQGTLYGEGSMGGAIKMVMTSPDPNEWHVRSSISNSKTKHGADNTDYRLAINVPLIDEKLGLRVVASKKFDSGYIDYTSIGKNNANSLSSESLRPIILWQATEWLSLEYMYLYDDSELDQLALIDSDNLDRLENSNHEDQYSNTEFITHSLTARVDLGFAQLTSVSAAFNTERNAQARNLFLGQVAEGNTGSSEAGDLFHTAFVRTHTDLESFSQELRLVSAGDERLDWIVGGFYRDREQKYRQELFEYFEPEGNAVTDTVFGLALGELSGQQSKTNGREPFKQTAAYTEVSYEILPGTLDLTAGLRWFEDIVQFSTRAEYYGAIALLVGTDPENVDENGQVYVGFADEITTRDWLPKLSLAWYANDDIMLFATVSKGFRSGTPNVYSALKAGPPLVRPDYVLNKEIGAKTTWLDGRVIVNLGIYQIDWEDFQGLVAGTAYLGSAGPLEFAYLANAGDAEVSGAELSTLWHVNDRLNLQFNAGYNDGEVTRPDPNNKVTKGSEVPNKPVWTWSLSGSYSQPLSETLSANFGLTYSYVDEQITLFKQDGEDNEGLPLEDFALLKASIGIEGSNWGIQLFANNITDERVVTAASIPGPRNAINRPRTMGLRFNWEY